MQPIQEKLRYEPDTGHFFWREGLRRMRTRIPGGRAGYQAANGYRYIHVNGKSIMEHRLAWLFVHGEWPSMDVDHRDGEKANNAISNLRLCTDSQNGGNQKLAKNNKSGFKGVFKNKKTGRFRAMVRVNWKLIQLGSYDTAEEAAQVAQKAREHYFGEFARAA